jgi:hypothetical protein
MPSHRTFSVSVRAPAASSILPSALASSPSQGSAESSKARKGHADLFPNPGFLLAGSHKGDGNETREEENEMLSKPNPNKRQKLRVSVSNVGVAVPD